MTVQSDIHTPSFSPVLLLTFTHAHTHEREEKVSICDIRLDVYMIFSLYLQSQDQDHTSTPNQYTPIQSYTYILPLHIMHMYPQFWSALFT